MSLQLQTLQLKKNTLIIDAHPVQVSEYIGTIKKTEEALKAEKDSTVFRTGIVVQEGIQDLEVREKFINSSGDIPETFVNCIVLFSARGVDPIDVPVEGVQCPVLINTEYLIAIIDETRSTPY